MNQDKIIELQKNDKTYFLTPEHKVLTQFGWKKVEDLTDTDKLVELNDNSFPTE